jgi:PKHD-type hydroxylase
MIQVFEKLIPDEVCDVLIEEGLNRPQLNAGIGEDNLLSEGRSTKISFIGNSVVSKYIEQMVASNYKNYTITEAEDLQFATYKAGDFYGLHKDSDETNGRILSVTVQLSDPSDYKGGFLQFQKAHKSTAVESSQGTVIIFPSNLYHEVTPVTEGTRYSLVQWFKGYESSPVE